VSKDLPVALATVIGGSGTVGTAVRRELAARRYETLATYRREPTPSNSPDLDWTRVDVSTGEGLHDLVRKVDQCERPLAALIYLVGAGSSKRTVEHTAVEEFQRLHEVNALGFLRCWRALGPALRYHRAGVVVVSSEAARVHSPGNGPYAASKVALESIALTLAAEEQLYGVRVNVLSPGSIRSPMAEDVVAKRGDQTVDEYYRGLPWGRPLDPAEVAEALVSVALDPGWGYATGQVFRLACGPRRSSSAGQASWANGGSL